MSQLTKINMDDFKTEVLQSDTPVLVEFGAAWCAPCRQLEPVLLKLAQEWSGKVRLVTVDVDDAAELAMQYRVMGVPTVILFMGGEAKERFTGFQPRERMIAKLGPSLGIS